MSDVLEKWQGYGSAITLIAGASMNNIATGSWMTSGSTLLDNGTNADVLCDIQLVLASSGVTAGSGTPRWDVYVVRAPNGTTAMAPPGTSAGLTPGQYFVGSILANPGVNFTSGTLAGVVLPAGKFVVTAQNNLGVNTPTSNDTTFLAYPYGIKGDV
jgi:hypothetical protein